MIWETNILDFFTSMIVFNILNLDVFKIDKW